MSNSDGTKRRKLNASASSSVKRLTAKNAQISKWLSQIQVTIVNHLHSDAPLGDLHPKKAALIDELQELINKTLPNIGLESIQQNLKKRSKCRSLVALKDGHLLAAMTICPFSDFNFTELIFCVVDQKYSRRGLGSILMNLLKDFCLTELNTTRLLTYADSRARDWFSRKHHFKKAISIDSVLYHERIYHCSAGATLMECKIDRHFKCPPSYAILGNWKDFPNSDLHHHLDTDELSEMLEQTAKLNIALNGGKPRKVMLVNSKYLNLDPKSILLLCTNCGTYFRDIRDKAVHMMQTGHIGFAKPLEDEEGKKKKKKDDPGTFIEVSLDGEEDWPLPTTTESSSRRSSRRERGGGA